MKKGYPRVAFFYCFLAERSRVLRTLRGGFESRRPAGRGGVAGRDRIPLSPPRTQMENGHPWVAIFYLFRGGEK